MQREGMRGIEREDEDGRDAREMPIAREGMIGVTRLELGRSMARMSRDETPREVWNR